MKYMLLVCGDGTQPRPRIAGARRTLGRGPERAARGAAARPPAPSARRRGHRTRARRRGAPHRRPVRGDQGVRRRIRRPGMRTLEEAVEAAAEHPVASFGAMEVRAFWDETDAETDIRRLDAELTEAARERDVERAMACYTPDTEVFPAASGQETSGIDALRKAEERGPRHDRRTRRARGAPTSASASTRASPSATPSSGSRAHAPTAAHWTPRHASPPATGRRATAGRSSTSTLGPRGRR